MEIWNIEKVKQKKDKDKQIKTHAYKCKTCLKQNKPYSHSLTFLKKVHVFCFVVSCFNPTLHHYILSKFINLIELLILIK
ncbi:hypothetical protein AQUCO_01500433v1 [Aquilegia coerulea]|uniref:Uncharacterized protein n=1 Tax=Aquilegia coerulea TaxID=218851 RepID=A0A2G5DTN0_AQUCA|nr:hypothetical protein AQUCO_01500433v1 [Aquilegia coerulea]